jgi:hypothetical protein
MLQSKDVDVTEQEARQSSGDVGVRCWREMGVGYACGCVCMCVCASVVLNRPLVTLVIRCYDALTLYISIQLFRSSASRQFECRRVLNGGANMLCAAANMLYMLCILCVTLGGGDTDADAVIHHLRDNQIA